MARTSGGVDAQHQRAQPLFSTRWQTALNHPNDARYVDLPYINLFVAAPGRPDGGVFQFVHLGADVIAANNPAPGGPDGGLYAVMPGGLVRKLFPLPVHEQIADLIDTPMGQLDRGAVVEPNISEDGRRVYFSWFHDQTWKKNNGGWLNQELSYKGCDIYSLDLTQLIANPHFDVSQLPIKRLTFKQYNGFHKANVKQTVASRNEWAINPTTPGHAAKEHGTCDMHMIEMRTEDGLKAVFVSDRARVANSNAAAHKPNHNFNLYQADILPDGSLGHVHQLQYFTTTSALSPENLRDGFTFSYQSSTDNFRRWDLQAVTSNGKWSPLLGYAQASELYHFGTLISARQGSTIHDWFIGVKYYNLNNGGFGQLQLLDMDEAGVNEFQYTPGQSTQPEQITQLLSLGVTIADGPSPEAVVNGQNVFIGKLTTPRAGRFGGEFLAAHTPTSANRWIADPYGNYGQFDSHIVYRPNILPFRPELPYDPTTQQGLAIVVDDSSGDYNLLWPTPVLSWQERFGTAQQDFSPSIVDTSSTVARGLPHADVGASAIWNTDIRPYDCFRGIGMIPYSPNNLTNVEEIDLDQSYEGLRYVQDATDVCRYLQPSAVLGIQVNITSNRTDWESEFLPAYETDTTYLTWARGRKEATRILGVYDVSLENNADQSFIARIPADVPFDFHLVDSRYGMKLVDVRSWHSLQPRETRVDCGGCHQHEAGMGIPFTGTEASLRQPLDMTSGTRFYAYDPDCRPSLQKTTAATVPVPEWTQDVWPGFDQHCGSCHNSIQSTNNAALVALDYVDEQSAFHSIRTRRYANTVLGALGSPAFWAAYGERTDGRDNTLAAYQPNYAAGEWGFKFSQIHATNPGLCAASDPVWAAWVHRFGQWIDNHMPRDTGNSPLGYQFDRFHPTVDFAYTRSDAAPGEIRIGFWDDQSEVTIEVFHNGILQSVYPAQPNGELLIDDGGLSADDVIRVRATDAAGNRQIKDKSIHELLTEG